MTYPSFVDHIRSIFGSNWCVAARASQHLRNKGYDTIITPKRYDTERDVWARHHPAWLLADTLPHDDAGRFVRKAVLRELGTTL